MGPASGAGSPSSAARLIWQNCSAQRRLWGIIYGQLLGFTTLIACLSVMEAIGKDTPCQTGTFKVDCRSNWRGHTGTEHTGQEDCLCLLISEATPPWVSLLPGKRDRDAVHLGYTMHLCFYRVNATASHTVLPTYMRRITETFESM